MRARLFLSYAAVVLLAVLAMAGTLGGMAFLDRQQRAFEGLLVQAREATSLLSLMEQGRLDMEDYRQWVEVLGARGMLFWHTGAEGLLYDAGGAAVGPVDMAILADLPSGGKVVTSGFERYFSVPMATAIVPHQEGATFLHRSMDALERGDLMVVWRQAALGALAGMAVGLLGCYILSRRYAARLEELARQAQAAARQGALMESMQQSEEGRRIATAVNALSTRAADVDAIRRAFVANVSHELRSPLTNIQGYLQAVVDGAAPPEEAEEYLAVALEETRRLSRLIQEIRSLSRVESDEAIEMEPFDVLELIRRSLAAYSGRLEENGIRVELEFRKDRCWAVGNPPLIRQVVDNLIDNAIKFTGQGGRLAIRVAEGSGRLFVTIADDGAGIAEADRPFVFDRFYKADQAHSGGGSGLGLAIVKSILDRHGQAIRLSSVEGKGTAMTFTLKSGEG